MRANSRWPTASWSSAHRTASISTCRWRHSSSSARRSATPYAFEPGVALLTCSAEDLIVYKAVAARPRDIEDIKTVVSRQGRRLDAGRVRRWLRVFAEVKDDPDLGRPFEDALRKATRPGS